jgi:hypothetical protein
MYLHGKSVALRLGLYKFAKEFAPGIPDRKNIESLPEILRPTNWTMAIQDHEADRAGQHYDLRLVDPATGHAHSWALPKARMPEPGKSVLAVQQPTHTKEYATEFGKERGGRRIIEGYGKGNVKLKEVVDADVFHSKPEETGTRLRFNIYRSTGPEEYALVRTSGGNDLLVNKTLTRERLKELDIGKKPSLKEKKVDAIDLDDDAEVMMPKYDGAHTLLSLRQADRIPRLFSYRSPKRHGAGVIEHTHKVPSLLTTRVPKDLKGTVLRTETVAVDAKGRALPAKDIAGMLNSTVPNSRKKQKEMGAQLRTIMLDVDKFKGKDVSELPFKARYELMRRVHDEMGIPIADIAESSNEKRRLLEAIRKGRHPMTSEGVILRPNNTLGKPSKAKFRPDHDVYVREIFEAQGKDGKGKGRAGGFAYSWSPQGKLVGRVGTGFNHELARDMLTNKSRYIGRSAKVEAETKHLSGALGKASFKEWHLDKGQLPAG